MQLLLLSRLLHCCTVVLLHCCTVVVVDVDVTTVAPALLLSLVATVTTVAIADGMIRCAIATFCIAHVHAYLNVRFTTLLLLSLL